MNILMFLSKNYSTDSRVTKEVDSLVKAGHKVIVIMWDRQNKYQHHDQEYGHDDDVIVYPLQNTFFMNLLPSDLFRNPFWWRMAYKKADQLFNDGITLHNKWHCESDTYNGNFDVVHCHDLDTLRMGVKLKKKYPTKIKLVYDAHEIFGYMIKGDVPGIVTKYAFYMEKKLLKYVDHVITTSDRFAEYFRTITDKPVSIVLNCATLIDVEPKFRNKLFTVIYTGSLEKDRMFPGIVDRLVLIPGIRIIIIARTENMDMYDRVKNILFKVVSKADIQLLSDLPYNYTMEYVMESDCVLSQLDPLKEIFSYALSTKQFDAMLCGKPVICTKGTYSGELTEKLGSGLVVDYTPDAVADAVTKLKDNPVLCKNLGDNGLHYARMEYNWDKQKDVLLRIYGEKI